MNHGEVKNNPNARPLTNSNFTLLQFLQCIGLFGYKIWGRIWFRRMNWDGYGCMVVMVVVMVAVVVLLVEVVGIQVDAKVDTPIFWQASLHVVTLCAVVTKKQSLVHV